MTDGPTVPTVKLLDGTSIPQLGFGVWQVGEDEAQKAVTEALDAGYRSIDTAAAYKNEAGVGRALAESAVDRDDVYVTTKLWNSDQGYDSTLKAFDASMEKLGIETLDLYLIHWAAPGREAYLNTWKAFIELQKSGRVRSIGVSNFHQPHLERIIGETGVVPVLNQIENHPYLVQKELREVNAAHGIATEAWSPLGSGHGLLEDPSLVKIAQSHDVTPAQVVLRWHLDNGSIVIPKSVTPSRIRENLDVFGFALTDEDRAAITGLDKHERTGPDPDEFNG